MIRSKAALERQLATLRKLIDVAEQFAQHVASVSPGSLHHEQVEDTIADGEYLWAVRLHSAASDNKWVRFP